MVSGRAEPCATMLLLPSVQSIGGDINFKVGGTGAYVYPKCFGRLEDLILSGDGEVLSHRR